MITNTEVSSLRDALKPHRFDRHKISLVPTMGNLHQGHLELVHAARNNSDIVVCSIFVNPLQFGPNEDLESYPRTLQADEKKLREAGCDFLFLPEVDEIYGSTMDEQTLIHVPGISEGFCNDSRPGHFDGVATVVCKLFNMVQPDIAYFGLKDYQQYLIIKKLTQDLSLDITIEGIEIQRNSKGLALSSRNSYLTAEEMEIAPLIQTNLKEVSERIQQGESDFHDLEKNAFKKLLAAGMRPEYFAICNAENLKPAQQDDSNLVILAACKLGACRLIDNIRFSLPK